MTISQDPSTPRIVVIGITGNQGGSVADHLIASNKPYRIVGLTRDITRPAAKSFAEKGVELKQVDFQPGNEAAVTEVFKDADIVFAVTNFNELLSEEKEVAQGKLMIDSANVAGVKLFIWSSNESIAEISSNKYRCAGFESKWAITQYLASSSLPYALVPCGSYLSNIMSRGPVLSPTAGRKQDDGTYIIYSCVSGKTELPIINTRKDYGAYVRAVIENPGMGAGSEVLTGVNISLDELVKALSEFTGHTFKFKQLSKDDYFATCGPYAAFIYDFFMAMEEFGYYGTKNVEASQKKAGVVPPPLSEMLKDHSPEDFL